VERETVVDTLHMRDKIEVKTVLPDEHRFAGKLIVLIDSRSASAAELLARVVQLEERGTVIGDRSAGMVMPRSQVRSRGSVAVAEAILSSFTRTDVAATVLSTNCNIVSPPFHLQRPRLEHAIVPA